MKSGCAAVEMRVPPAPFLARLNTRFSKIGDRVSDTTADMSQHHTNEQQCHTQSQKPLSHYHHHHHHNNNQQQQQQPTTRFGYSSDEIHTSQPILQPSNATALADLTQQRKRRESQACIPSSPSTMLPVLASCFRPQAKAMGASDVRSHFHLHAPPSQKSSSNRIVEVTEISNQPYFSSFKMDEGGGRG